MAGRGAKSKEYRLQVTSVKHWLKEIDSPALLGISITAITPKTVCLNRAICFLCTVVEVYSSWFGSCQVIPPTINNIMLNIDDSENKIKWPVVTKHFSTTLYSIE